MNKKIKKCFGLLIVCLFLTMSLTCSLSRVNAVKSIDGYGTYYYPWVYRAPTSNYVNAANTTSKNFVSNDCSMASTFSSGVNIFSNKTLKFTYVITRNALSGVASASYNNNRKYASFHCEGFDQEYVYNTYSTSHYYKVI